MDNSWRKVIPIYSATAVLLVFSLIFPLTGIIPVVCCAVLVFLTWDIVHVICGDSSKKNFSKQEKNSK